MARQLHADGQEVGLVGLLDAFGGNHYSLALPSRLVRWGGSSCAGSSGTRARSRRHAAGRSWATSDRRAGVDCGE
jgi:hypothetical protein